MPSNTINHNNILGQSREKSMKSHISVKKNKYLQDTISLPKQQTIQASAAQLVLITLKLTHSQQPLLVIGYLG